MNKKRIYTTFGYLWLSTDRQTFIHSDFWNGTFEDYLALSDEVRTALYNKRCWYLA